MICFGLRKNDEWVTLCSWTRWRGRGIPEFDRKFDRMINGKHDGNLSKKEIEAKKEREAKDDEGESEPRKGDHVACRRVVQNARRLEAQLDDVLCILLGLQTACNFRVGNALVAGRSLQACAPFFRRVFEVGRRHKIMNPAKMRDTYGKMMCILQDASGRDVRHALGFSLRSPVRTVRARALQARVVGQDRPGLALRRALGVTEAICGRLVGAGVKLPKITPASLLAR